MMAAGTRRLEGEATIRVPFSHADPAGVVWHGRYFEYFDAARCDLLGRIDYGYKAMARSGFLWPVVDARLRFVRAVGFDDLIRVRATLVEWEYRIKIAYEVLDESDVLTTAGFTIHAAVDQNSGKLCLEVPAFLRERIERALGD